MENILSLKNIGTMLKFGIILALFAGIACVMLAFVFEGTKSIIDQRRQEALEASLIDLFPDADDFNEVDNLQSPDATVSIASAYVLHKDGEVIGIALTTSRGSYSGQIKIMTGVRADGSIAGVKIIEHSDTPGFGSKAGDPRYFINPEKTITFYGQFAGKLITFEPKNDVVAITGSTITSNAVFASVKAAGIAAEAWFVREETDAVSGASIEIEGEEE